MLFVIGIGRAALMAIFLILRANGVLMQNTKALVVISGISGLDTSTNSSDDSSSGSSATLSVCC